jgi:hypothetical protein
MRWSRHTWQILAFALSTAMGVLAWLLPDRYAWPAAIIAFAIAAAAAFPRARELVMALVAWARSIMEPRRVRRITLDDADIELTDITPEKAEALVEEFMKRSGDDEDIDRIGDTRPGAGSVDSRQDERPAGEDVESQVHALLAAHFARNEQRLAALLDKNAGEQNKLISNLQDEIRKLNRLLAEANLELARERAASSRMGLISFWGGVALSIPIGVIINLSTQ